MKKMLLLLSLTLTLTFVGCNDNETASTSGNDPNSASEATAEPQDTKQTDNTTSDLRESQQTDDATANNDETNLIPKAPINLFNGNIYGGMSEADAMAYMETTLGLYHTAYTDSGDYTHAGYVISDYFNLGTTNVDIQSHLGKVKYVEFRFRKATPDQVITELSNRYGANYTTKDYDGYTMYTWEFADAKGTVQVYDEARDTMSFNIVYPSNKQ